MKNIIIAISLLLLNCYGGAKQKIILMNGSSENIFYCIHGNALLNTEDIERIRPWTEERIKEHHHHLIFENMNDSLKNASRLREGGYLIKKNQKKVIFASRGVMIYNNKEQIQEQIKNEYGGRLRVSIISESDLKKYSNETIINKNIFKPFISITGKDITRNTLFFKYK